MTRKSRQPITTAPQRLRQRQRADGSWRIWWEPRAEDRKLGFEVVELAADRLDWSMREAKRLNAELERAQKAGTRKDAPRSSSRTISDLIQDYQRSVHYTGTLADATRKSYRVLMLQIEDKWGVRRVVDFDKPTMTTWYQTLYHGKGPRIAQALIRMMSILFSHAENVLGWRPENSNPCLRLKVQTPEGRSRVATWPEIDALLAAADAAGLPSMALAIRIGLFQGQRETDVIKATRGAFQLLPVRHEGEAAARPVWVWSLRRSKKSNDGVMAVHDEVIPSLRLALAETGSAEKPRKAADRLLIEERIGRAYDVDLFAKRWAEVRELAAKQIPSVATLQYRDLRRTFGVLARAGGASKDDAGDVLGNSAANNPLLGEIYMPSSFHTASRAVAAVQRPKGQVKKGNRV